LVKIVRAVSGLSIRYPQKILFWKKKSKESSLKPGHGQCFQQAGGNTENEKPEPKALATGNVNEMKK
jgi:hypothetical protein